jgi:hypothetical protein
MLTQSNIWKELELGLGSGAKFRILLSMILNPKTKFTKYLLVKWTGLRTPDVDKQLKLLRELGWIKEDLATPFSDTSYIVDLDNTSVKWLIELVSNLRCVKGTSESISDFND